MKIKRILSLLLTVLLVLSSVPMLAISAEDTAVEGESMLHFTDAGDRIGYLGKGVKLVSGETYAFTFKHKFVEGGFKFGGAGTGLTVGLFIVDPETGELISTERNTERDDTDSRKPKYTIININEGTVSFEFEIKPYKYDEEYVVYPDTGETGTFAFGFLTSESVEVDMYATDFAVYNVNDPSKTNLFAEETGDFTGWYGYCETDGVNSSEFIGYDESGAISGASFKGGQNHFEANILPIDNEIFPKEEEEPDDRLPTMEEPSDPERMVYLKSSSSDVFGVAVVVEPNKSYYFSFGIVSGTDPSSLSISAMVNNDNKTPADITTTYIESVDHGTYSWVTYQVDIPEEFVSEANLLFLGFNISAGAEAYIFNWHLYDPLTPEENLISADPSGLGSFIYGAWIFWGNYYCYQGEMSEDGTSWTDGSGIARVEEYDTSKFSSLKKMLYFRYEQDASLLNRVSVKAGKKYNLTFSVTNSISTVYVSTCTGSNRMGIDSTIVLNEQVDYGTYSTYKYSIEIPGDYVGESDSLGTAFVGISFGSGDKGYLFSVKLTDTTGKNILSNGGFASGLSNWAHGWDAWFGYTTDNTTEWYKSGELRLKTLTFDESLFDEFVKKTMIHYTGTVSNADMSYVGQKVTLTKGNTYKISYKYRELLGGIDETVYLSIGNLVDNRISEIYFSNKEIDNAVPFNVEHDAESKTYTYTFTLEGDHIADLTDTADYSLAFTSWDTENKSDIYIGDLEMYNAADSEKRTLLTKGSYANNTSGYFGNTTEASNTSKAFTDSGCTVQYAEYNPYYFSSQKTMLHIKEYKSNGYDELLQRTQQLEPNVEYTVSFNYYLKSGDLDVSTEMNSVFFGMFGGTNNPGDGAETFNALLRGNQTRLGGKTFTTSEDTGRTITYTFTLSEAEINNSNKYYGGFYFMPDPDIVTELYVSDLVLYESADEDKTNLFLSDEYEGWVNNWYSHWGFSLSGNNELFSRSEIEFYAEYLPYDASLLDAPVEAGVHYGDSNADGTIDVRDLVNMKKLIANSKNFKLADIDENGDVAAPDLVLLKKHILGVETLEAWSDYEISLMDDFNLTGGAEEEATTLKEEIDIMEDTVADNATGTVYYVAADGKSTNAGTSPEAPINVGRVNSLSLKSGDAVVFKRGDIFRISEYIVLKSDVAYGAYGTGAKPEISGSLRDYADKNIWNSEDGNIWKVSLGTADASNIVFDGGESVGFRKNALDKVETDGDFYYDTSSKILYLYLSQINPGNYFDSIEIATTNYILYSYGSTYRPEENIKIENLSLKYGTTMGMRFAFSKDFDISGCEISWIGGAWSGSDQVDRYGNGIEIWRYANNCMIYNNYIHQIYDAAITFQGSTDNDYTNLYFVNNLIEYCSMNFEFWASDDDSTSTSSDPDATFSDIYFGYNILRFGGYGFGGLQRNGILDQAYVLAWFNNYDDSQVEGFAISENIFDVANCNYIFAPSCMDLLTINGNTYYQNANSIHPIVRSMNKYAKDQASFEAAVTAVDKEANVIWVAE